MASTFLKQLSFFEEVSEAELGTLEGMAEPRSLKPNQVVFRKGDACDGIYVVTGGGVMIRREEPGQPVERLRDLTAGEVFGEMEMVDGVTPRQFTARTLGASAILLLPVAPLRELFKRHPTVETRLRTLVIHRRTSRLRSRLGPSARREPRIWVDREVRLSLDGGVRLDAHLENLSHGGLCLADITEVLGDWQPQRTIEFSLGTAARPDLLKVRGVVRWRHNGAVGIAFELAEHAGSTQHRRRIDSALRELVPAG